MFVLVLLLVGLRPICEISACCGDGERGCADMCEHDGETADGCGDHDSCGDEHRPCPSASGICCSSLAGVELERETGAGPTFGHGTVLATASFVTPHGPSLEPSRTTYSLGGAGPPARLYLKLRNIRC